MIIRCAYDVVSGHDVWYVMRAGLRAEGGRGRSERFRIDTYTPHVAHYRTFIRASIVSAYDARYLHNT